MNPSYFRIRLNIDKAIERLCNWNNSNYREKIEIEYFKAIDVSLDENGQWKGSCLYVYENGGWTIFEDLSGSYSFIEADDWKNFAQNDELLFAGYNDSIFYAEMLMIKNAAITKYFIENNDIPEDNINEGDGIEDIQDWTDVAEFMDNDELACSDSGIVLIF